MRSLLFVPGDSARKLEKGLQAGADALLLDLPPGTGDVAISLGQHLPSAEVVVVTTPQEAAAEVAERAGTMASMMHQRVVGVVENMAALTLPDGTVLDVFGSGGGDTVAASLSRLTGTRVGHHGANSARARPAPRRHSRRTDHARLNPGPP